MKNILFILILGFLTGTALAQQKKPAAKPKPKPDAAGQAMALQQASARGKAVYLQYCVACHQADGAGVEELNPPVIKSPYVGGDKAKLIQVILNGMQNVEIHGQSYSNLMPPHNFLTDQQIADVLTYVRNNFTNKASIITMAEVKAVRAKTK